MSAVWLQSGVEVCSMCLGSRSIELLDTGESVPLLVNGEPQWIEYACLRCSGLGIVVSEEEDA